MTRIKALVVDDEPLAREGTVLLLRDDPEIEIIGECKNGLEAVEIINNSQIDLVFLDVQMPEMDGFETVANILPGKLPVIIFITAFDKYALQAFKAHAIDYLLKPYTDEDFFTALKKAKEYISLKNIEQLSRQLAWMLGSYTVTSSGLPGQQMSEYTTRFSISSSGSTYFVKTEDIDWIEAADYYIQLHVNNKVHLMRETMDNLESKLNPKDFARIHRSTIVNINRIREIQQYAKGEYIAILHDQTKLKISRNYIKRIKELK